MEPVGAQNSPGFVSNLVMRTTGLSSPLPCCSIVRSGAKTKISSAAVLRHGLQRVELCQGGN
jgi:hypothetical protein